MSESSGWLGLLFGAIVVVFYSFERFNRANYEERYNLDELMQLLPPDQLRGRTVVMRAYIGYTVMILSVYFLVCGFSNVFALLGLPGSSGSQLGGGAETIGSNADGSTTQSKTGIDPKVSLGVALIMVGLAPSVPVLKRLEEQARNWAHRLAGIPTHVLNIRDTLRHRKISLPKDHDYKLDGLMIDANDWKRIDSCNHILRKLDMDPRSFEQKLLIIFAASNWILDKKLKLHRVSDRQRFLQLEDKLRIQRKEFVATLDELTNFHTQTDSTLAEQKPAAEKDGDENADNGDVHVDRLIKWERINERADELVNGFCLLIALYIERGIILQVADDIVTRGNGNQAHWARQYEKARALLKEFTDNTINESRIQDATTREAIRIFVWTSISTILLTLAWSLTLGKLSYGLQYSQTVDNWFEPAWVQFLEALFSFCLPLGVALMVCTYLKNQSRWQNTWSARMTGLLPQYFMMVLISWLLTMLIVLGVFIWLTAVTENWGWDLAVDRIPYVFEYEAIPKLRGVVLAVFIVVLLDALPTHKSTEKQYHPVAGPAEQRLDEAKSEPAPDRPRSPPEDQNQVNERRLATWFVLLTVGTTMGFLGFSGQYIRSSIFARRNNLTAFDSIDGGMIVYSTLYSAFVGMIVMYVFTRILRDWHDAESAEGNAAKVEVT